MIPFIIVFNLILLLFIFYIIIYYVPTDLQNFMYMGNLGANVMIALFLNLNLLLIKARILLIVMLEFEFYFFMHVLCDRLLVNQIFILYR